VSSLFDVAEVLDGDGPWSGVPYDEQYDAGARPLIVQDVCTRANVARVAGSLGNPAVVYTIRPFGAMVSALRPNRCVIGDFPDFDASLHADLKQDAQRAAAYVLWNGIPGWTSAQPFMTSSDVTDVGTSATVQDVVAKVLDQFYDGEVGEHAVLHMGLRAAMLLSAGNAMSPTPQSGEFYLTMDGTPIVVAPEYPISQVGATGPIKVRRSNIGDLVPSYDYAQNRTSFTTDMVLAVEFDASIAVRGTLS
jgi:hypothetical protein